MKKFTAVPFFFAAIFILVVSALETASVKYVFSQKPSPTPITTPIANINYTLPVSELTPDSFMWPAQAFFDQINLSVAKDGLDKAHDYLNYADIRLVGGAAIVQKGKTEEGFLVLTKAEQYLKKSHEMVSTAEDSPEKQAFLVKLSLASLKHREILETILMSSPEDARPVIAKTLDISKLVYEVTASSLVEDGLEAPINPFGN